MEARLLNTTEELVKKGQDRSATMLQPSGYDISSRVSGESIFVNPGRIHTPTPELTTYGDIKLGWIQGVLIPCLLNIWGVMLFLRMAWIVAQAGIVLSVVIIFIAGVVCVITTLSLSAICTNGQLQGGGVYFLVSRSLGAELGASVGIIFAFANAVAASMNTIGFCDSLNELLKKYSLKIIDNGPNDTRIIGAFSLFLMCVICAVGMDWETKTQNFLIIIIVTAIVNFVVGSALGPKSDQIKAEGFVGLSLEGAQRNWLPDFRFSEGEYHNFFSVFAIYFPAVTGVQAGANICGDLKDPATAIPKGTLLALAISITSYLTMAALSGVGGLRDASGNVGDLANGTIDSCKPNCDYGLHNNYEIMNLMAFWGPLIYGGCWAATLSTALTNLLSVPRLIQALGFDQIYPGLIFFSKRYGAHGEPYRGYVLTFLVSVCFLLIADLNTIAPLITNFYLASYALINFCTFHAAFFKPISWRPQFKYYNTWVSLVGFLLCIIIMMIISWVMALLTTFIFITLYLLVLYRKPETTWSGSTDAQRYQETITSILQISQRTTHIRSFNPQLLVLAGKPDKRPWLLDVAALITQIGSFMVAADIEPNKLSPMERYYRRSMGEEWMRAHKLRGFYVLLQGFDYEKGLEALVQSSGLGRVSPNILLLGYKHNWEKCQHQHLLSYYRMVRLTFELDLAVAILRVPANMRPPKRFIEPLTSASAAAMQVDEPAHARTISVMSSDSEEDIIHYEQYKTHTELEKKGTTSNEGMTSKQQGTSTTSRRLRFGSYKVFTLNHSSVLDAWWLYDDGGMNILLPYIITRRAVKDKIPLRIFALPRRQQKLSEAEQEMITLLKKFRIDYSQLTMVSVADKPMDTTWALFNSVIQSHKTSEDHEILISEAEGKRYHDKICRHLRLRELLLENSNGADIIVMTLPFPRKGLSAAMYMAWLEVMSLGMPPMLFVRGNSTVVIE